MGQPRITVYSARQCAACRQVRNYLQLRKLAFQELDVNTSLRAQKALARLGARSVPVIMIGDDRVDGFDRKRLDQLLARFP